MFLSQTFSIGFLLADTPAITSIISTWFGKNLFQNLRFPLDTSFRYFCAPFMMVTNKRPETKALFHRAVTIKQRTQPYRGLFMPIPENCRRRAVCPKCFRRQVAAFAAQGLNSRSWRNARSGSFLLLMQNDATSQMKIYRIQALINFIGTSIRSATCSGVIPLFKKRLHTTFIFSPTSMICLSGS